MIRVVLITLLVCFVLFGLIKTLYHGIQTGKMHHTDTQKYCDRSVKPVCFWMLFALFSIMIIALLYMWYQAVIVI